MIKLTTPVSSNPFGRTLGSRGCVAPSDYRAIVGTEFSARTEDIVDLQKLLRTSVNVKQILTSAKRQ
eukprot:440393-Amphidinium_carterae.1